MYYENDYDKYVSQYPDSVFVLYVEDKPVYETDSYKKCFTFFESEYGDKTGDSDLKVVIEETYLKRSGNEDGEYSEPAYGDGEYIYSNV